MFNFEKLEVWQRAIAFTGIVYAATFQSIYNEAEAISRMLSGLRPSLMKTS